MKLKLLPFYIGLLLILSACGVADNLPAIGASATPTVEPTATALLPTNTPTATPSATPTATPTVTATPLPTMTETPANPADSFKDGFVPDPKLIDVSDTVNLRAPAADLSLYQCFPQDYSRGDLFNAGCAALQKAGKLPWAKPLAGYNYDYNASCVDATRHCNIPVDTWKWVTITGEAIYLPGIGTFKDPDGGIAQVMIMNPWEVPGELTDSVVIHGYWGTGEVFDMSDLTTKWDEKTKSYVDNEFGTFSLETSATLRDHWLWKNGYDPEFRGKCSKGENCETVTWVNVFRWYDGNYYLLGTGQWVRPQ